MNKHRSLDPYAAEHDHPANGIVGELADGFRQVLNEDLKAGTIDQAEHQRGMNHLNRVSPPAPPSEAAGDTTDDGRI